MQSFSLVNPNSGNANGFGDLSGIHFVSTIAVSSEI